MISRFIHRVKLVLKRVKVSDYSKFFIGQKSGIGLHSRILFSEQVHDSTSKIVIGNNAGTGRNCELHVWNNNSIIIKDHSTLNDGCKLLGDVTIERYCVLSANIFASSGNHYAFEKPTWLIRDQDALVLSTKEGLQKHSQPIHVEEDCWIGVGVFIKQGVYIGRGAVVGANAVVLKNVAPYSVIGGSPAKEIRKRFDFEPPHSITATNELHLPYFYRGFDHKRESYSKAIEHKVINGGRELIIVLGRTDKFSEVIIQGRRICKDTRYRITLDDKYQWEIKSIDEHFKLHLSRGSSINTGLMKNSSLYMSLSDDVKKHHIICITAPDEGAGQTLGIEHAAIA